MLIRQSGIPFRLIVLWTGAFCTIASAELIPRLGGPIEDVWTSDRPTGSWLEGPSFGAGAIWFADPGNTFLPEPDPTRLMRFDPESRQTTTAIDLDANPIIFGTEFDREGRLLTTHLVLGTVTRRDVERLNEFEVLANGFEDPTETFIPNDLAVDASGRFVFLRNR